MTYEELIATAAPLWRECAIHDRMVAMTEPFRTRTGRWLIPEGWEEDAALVCFEWKDGSSLEIDSRFGITVRLAAPDIATAVDLVRRWEECKRLPAKPEPGPPGTAGAG